MKDKPRVGHVIEGPDGDRIIIPYTWKERLQIWWGQQLCKWGYHDDFHWKGIAHCTRCKLERRAY